MFKIYQSSPSRWTFQKRLLSAAAFTLLTSTGYALPNEKSTVAVHTAWGSVDSYYRPITMAVQNLTNEDIKTIKMGFSLVKGIPSQHTGFVFSVDGTRITGYFQNWKLPLEAHATKEVSIGVSFPDGSGEDGVLPKHFCIEGQIIAPDQDTEPPSIPNNVTLLTAGAFHVKIEWDPSTDNVAVAGYKVQYQEQSDIAPPTILSVQEPWAMLSHLLPNHVYQAKVCAFDLRHNLSDYSELLTFRTEEDGAVPSSRLAMPYTDGVAWPTPALEHLVSRSGVSGSIVGFVVLRDRKPCWGGHLSVYDSNTGKEEDGDARQSDYHKNFFERNSRSLISIGGAAGLPMCSDASLSPDDLCAQYQAIIKNYTLEGLDFDFEGGFLGDTAALTRHLEAIQRLKEGAPETKIGYTLPVDGSATLQGFNQHGRAFLSLVQRYHIEPTYIQGMLMEFGASANPNFFEACKDALYGMHTHLKEIFDTLWSDTEIWQHMAACPMFGINNNGRRFTLEHQKQLNDFCKQQNMMLMGGWDMSRDEKGGLGVAGHQPLDFSKEVARFVFDDQVL
ncbi:MAG: fibronectin type III domain-containing protein [Holosporaceae bacterium]